MAGVGSVKRIPNFVKSRSPKGLRDLMLEVNARAGKQHEWIHIYYVPDEKMHYAWYMAKVEINMVTGEMTDG